MNCRRARASFPDLVAGAAGAAAASHVSGCPACAGELEAFRAVLAAAARCRESDVPDPGEAYWDRFLPSVRARIAREGGRAASTRWTIPAAAAAALVMLAAATGALMAPGGPPGSALSVAEAGRRLDEAFISMPELAPEVSADMLGTDPIEALSTARILQAIDEAEEATAWGAGWPVGDVERMLDRLTVEQATRLKAELSAERG